MEKKSADNVERIRIRKQTSVNSNKSSIQHYVQFQIYTFE